MSLAITRCPSTRSSSINADAPVPMTAMVAEGTVTRRNSESQGSVLRWYQLIRSGNAVCQTAFQCSTMPTIR